MFWQKIGDLVSMALLSTLVWTGVQNSNEAELHHNIFVPGLGRVRMSKSIEQSSFLGPNVIWQVVGDILDNELTVTVS